MMFLSIIYLALICFLIIATIIDIEKRIVPNWITFTMVFLGVLFYTFYPHELALSFGWYFGIILILFALVVFIPQKIIGGGDLKLYAGTFALIGDPILLLYIITLSNIFSFIIMKFKKKTNIAHVPFILISTLLVFLLTV